MVRAGPNPLLAALKGQIQLAAELIATSEHPWNMIDDLLGVAGWRYRPKYRSGSVPSCALSADGPREMLCDRAFTGDSLAVCAVVDGAHLPARAADHVPFLFATG